VADRSGTQQQEGRLSRKNLNPVNPRTPKRVAIVLSNPAVSTSTGLPVGFWWSELIHPYFRFAEIGYEVDIYSPVGGRRGTDAMIDPDDVNRRQAEDVISRGFKRDPDFMRMMENTAKVDDIDAGRYDALVVAGGQGPDVHLREGPELQAKFSGVLRDRQADGRALPRHGHLC
jgi:putative intracellular protease/amidase